MIVFYKERLVMLSVPKTGTTAYQTALRDRADLVVSGPPELKHAPLYRYDRFFRPIYEKVCKAEMEIMAVVREPISWLGSWYRYRQRPGLKGQRTSTEGVSFDDYVLSYLKGQRPPFANVGSQSAFLTPRPGAKPADHLFRFEDQPGIQSFLGKRLGMQVQPDRLNVSPDMTLVLSANVERRLRRKCAAEFKLYDGIEISRR